MPEIVNLFTEVKALGTEAALDLVLEALHDWAFKPAGEGRDRELGNRIWAISCAVHPTQPTEETIAWAKKALEREYGENVTVREVGTDG